VNLHTGKVIQNNTARKYTKKAKGREIIFNRDGEVKGDWAAMLAKTITGGNVEDYLLRHGLYKKSQ
jgi:GMP synthase PP-ATPase subunit